MTINLTAPSPFDTLRRNGYNVIVADPPWLYQKQPGTKGARAAAPGTTDLHYSTMPNEAIAALPVADLAADNAHLFMWVTNPGLYGGRFSTVTPHDIARQWGFAYKTMLTWVKTSASGAPSGGGMGWYFRGATEHVLYATRGRAGIPAARRRPNVIMAPRGPHSAKPETFLDLVEATCDGPYLELFARTRRPGWDVWGDQAPTAEAPVPRRNSPAPYGPPRDGALDLYALTGGDPQ